MTTIEKLAMLLVIEAGCIMVLLGMIGCYFERALNGIENALRTMDRGKPTGP